MGRVYGESTFGDSLYGVTKYLDGATALTGGATSSASGVFVIDGSANTVVATSATASAAVEVYDGLASGGGSAVGSTATAYRTRNVSATIAASITSASASLQFLSNGEAHSTPAASTTSTGERIAIGTASVTATSGFDASANATYQPTLAISNASALTADSQRIHQGSGISRPALVFDATGRFKYEPQEPEYEIWTEVS